MKTKLNRGMTLIELTVVILVLLSLISVLFIGAKAWKAGSDRAQCILNIRNAQTAGRSWQNMYSKADGATVTATTDLVGSGKFLEAAPACPASGTYTWATAVPALGSLYLSCSLSSSDQHVPSNTTGW